MVEGIQNDRNELDHSIDGDSVTAQRSIGEHYDYRCTYVLVSTIGMLESRDLVLRLGF